MIINAELLLQYQRCKRRPFLDIHGDTSQRDAPNELLQKLQQDKIAHQLSALAQMTYYQPDYAYGNWEKGEKATLELMQRGVEYIYKGVLLANYSQAHTLLSRPDLLVKQPGDNQILEIGSTSQLVLNWVSALSKNIKLLLHFMPKYWQQCRELHLKQLCSYCEPKIQIMQWICANGQYGCSRFWKSLFKY
ncbi:hypothetical protein NSTCB13_03948 [Nostoc sp. DSM 114160]|jgi:predicted RecB family nuclease